MTSDTTATESGGLARGVIIRQVANDQWDTVAWLWQLFRHDLAPIVHGLPYADGRYQASPLKAFPSAQRVGYLA